MTDVLRFVFGQLFENVLASIGDQQTVEEDLSSFSSHMKTLNTMVQCGKDRSLILLDEICSGTDPAQGSALAQAKPPPRHAHQKMLADVRAPQINSLT